ncbi:MAG: T3SS (YopN, CesT) and YbjN peptide-binding chaperone 1 [Propionibacteriaceae bacterium]
MDSSDYADFDIDRSTAQAWAEFESRLSEVISMIDDSADLTIGTEATGPAPGAGEPGGPYVRFCSPSTDLVRCEAASNSQLAEPYQLGTEQLALMESIGWQPPAAAGNPPTTGFWVQDDQENSDRLAELTVTALRDAYGVQHPVFLAPDQLAEILTPKEEPLPVTPALSPALDADDVIATVAASQQQLDELVEAELTDLFGHPPIRDEEGDVAIRVGSTMLFLRTASDGREIVIFSALVHDVAGRSRAMEVLNDLNCDARWVKFQLIRDRVFVSLSVPAHPFVPAHLRQAVAIMSDVADGIDEELALKLDGRTTFEGPDERP